MVPSAVHVVVLERKIQGWEDVSEYCWRIQGFSDASVSLVGRRIEKPVGRGRVYVPTSELFPLVGYEIEHVKDRVASCRYTFS